MGKPAHTNTYIHLREATASPDPFIISDFSVIRWNVILTLQVTEFVNLLLFLQNNYDINRSMFLIQTHCISCEVQKVI
jgi:hypothetical protein